MIDLLIGDKNYEDYVEKIGALSKTNTYIANIRYFPNGEILVKIPDTNIIYNKNVAVFFPTYPDTNNRLIGLFQLIDILNDYGARSINLVIPYLSYSRQDKRFLDGECVSLKLFLDILSNLRVSSITSFDVHNEKAVNYFFKGNFINLQIGLDLVKYIIDNFDLDSVVILAPDIGRWETVLQISKKLDIPATYLIKERDRYTGKVEIKGAADSTLIKGDIIILDDEISTGGTMIDAINYLKKFSVKDIYVAATHLLLINNADKKLFDNGAKVVIGSNTIRNKYGLIRIENYIARLILNGTI